MQEPMSNRSSSPIQEDTGSAGTTFLLAVIGGLVGALVGGGVWALVGILTEREVGYVALLVGALAGGGVVVLARKRGVPFQVIAVACALIGLIIGKYLLYYHFNRKEFVDTLGSDAWAATGWSLTSSDMIQFFLDDLGSILQAIDLLFIALAVLAAWGIPGARTAQPKEAAGQPK